MTTSFKIQMITLLGIFAPLNASAFAQNTESLPVTKTQVSFGLTALSIHEGPNYAKIGGANLNGHFETQLNPKLEVNADGSILTRSGASNYYRNNDYRPISDLVVSEVALTWTPFSETALKAGILDQNHFDVPNIIAGESFTATRESWGMTGDILGVSLEAQQAIPTSNYARNREGRVDDESANFFYERINLNLKPCERFNIGLRATHFAFNGLGPDLAQTAQYQGNSTTGRGDNASFLTPFQGYEATLRTDLQLSFDTRAFARLTASENLQADEGHNLGSYYEGGFQIGDQVNPTTFSVGWFETGADLTPAPFNNALLGHNNRKGYFAKGTVNFPDSPFYLSGMHVVAEELVDITTLEKFEAVSAEVGVRYAL